MLSNYQSNFKPCCFNNQPLLLICAVRVKFCPWQTHVYNSEWYQEKKMSPHGWPLWCFDGHFITRILCLHVNNNQLYCRQAACLAGKAQSQETGWEICGSVSASSFAVAYLNLPFCKMSINLYFQRCIYTLEWKVRKFWN